MPDAMTPLQVPDWGGIVFFSSLLFSTTYMLTYRPTTNETQRPSNFKFGKWPFHYYFLFLLLTSFVHEQGQWGTTLEDMTPLPNWGGKGICFFHTTFTGPSTARTRSWCPILNLVSGFFHYFLFLLLTCLFLFAHEHCFSVPLRHIL